MYDVAMDLITDGCEIKTFLQRKGHVKKNLPL
jgi:hypothetical protein